MSSYRSQLYRMRCLRLVGTTYRVHLAAHRHLALVHMVKYMLCRNLLLPQVDAMQAALLHRRPPGQPEHNQAVQDVRPVPRQFKHSHGKSEEVDVRKEADVQLRELK